MAENTKQKSVKSLCSCKTKKLIEKEDFKIQSCRLCECKVSEISKEAWIADGATASPFCDLDLCSFHEMEDESDDEVRIEFEQVSVRTRGRYTYGLEAFEKNAMIIFAQSEEREQQVNDRIAMLKSRFGEFRFETDVHVDQSVEEMKSALEEFFSRDLSAVGAVAVVVLARAGEAGLVAARAQRCHESALLRWLTDDQPAALRGKPKIYITEANRTGVTADTGCYSLPLNKYHDLDVLGIHIPVLIDGESHPLKILCEQLGSADFLDAVYTAAHSAEITFPELKDHPIQVTSTLQMQLRLEKAS
ncbi:uncharacterized protein isoform X2 [Choristoneura fumiferana]|uniref:uncharacterized protein isoform X2 n=1 Tax=Choristoneura fumiferana TaxID=7141 RepID=UPI003D15B36E